MSSYLNAKSPVLNMKIHSVAEKQAWSSMSSSLSVDYQKEKSRKHSVKFSTKGRNLSSPRMTKLSASAQFESTQKPAWNWMMSWDMQSKPSEAIKNDMIFKYGRNPETSFVHLVQSSKFGDSSSLTENRIAIEAPHLGIDSELKVGTNFDFKDQILFHTESDLRYSADKHIKSLIHLNRESVKPLKMSVNFKLEYPGRKVMFTDEIEEKTRGEFHGKTKVQWQEGHQANMDYKYKQMSDRFKTHHELETSFKAPFLQEPIQHKGLVRLTRESADIQSKFSTSSESEYNIDVKLRRKGVSHVSVSIPRGRGILEVNCEDDRKSVNLDIRCKRHSQHHIIGSASLTSGSKKSFQAELSWNADQDPSRKVSFTAELEASTRYSKSYSLAATAHYLDAVALDISLRGENTMSGPHKLRIDMTGTKFEPVTIILDHEIVSGDIHSSLQYHRSNSEKLKAELNGKFSKHSSGMEISGGLSVTSPDRSYEEKEIYLSYKYSHSHSSLSVASEMRVQLRANKMYKAHLDISKESSSAKLKASLMTPHRGWEKQHIAAELKGDESGTVMKTEAEWSPRKKFSVSSEWKITEAGRDHKLKVTSTFPSLREGTFFVTFQRRMPQFHIESYMDINSNRKFDALIDFTKSPRKLGFHLEYKSEYTPAFLATFKHEKNADTRSIEMLLKKDSDKVMSFRSEVKYLGDIVDGSFNIQGQHREIVEIKIRSESIESGKKYSIKVKGQFAPITVTAQLMNADENSVNVIVSTCRETSRRICYSAKGYYKKEYGTSRYYKYHKVSLDVERVTGSSPADHLCSIHYLLSEQSDTFRSKLFLEASDKRIGYDLKKRSEAGDSSDLDLSVTLPFRTVRAKTQVTKSDYVERYAVEVLLDAERQADKKWAIQMSRERRENSEERIPEYVGHVVLTHPALEKPVDFEYTVAKRPSRFPIRGKFELDYSRNPGDKLTAELRIDADRRNPEKKMYVYHIYRQDKDLDFSVKILKHNAPETQKYGWLWSWQSQREVKTGGFIATITNDRRLGVPAAVNITYYSPSNEIQILGHSTERTSDHHIIVFKILVNGNEAGGATYTYNKPCLELEIQGASPLVKYEICINKNQAQRVHFVSLKSFFHDRKIIHASINLNPTEAHLAGVELQWKKEDLKESLDSLKELMPSLNHVPWEEIKEEMKEKISLSVSPFKNEIWKPVKAYLKNEIAKIAREQKEEIRLIKETVTDILEKLPSWRTVKEKYVRPILMSASEWWGKVKSSIEKMLPEKLKNYFRSVWEAIMRHTRYYCSRGSFCYQVKYTYRRGGVSAIYNLIVEKLREATRHNMNFLKGYSWMPRFSLMGNLKNWMHDMKIKIQTWIESVKDYAATKTLVDWLEDFSAWLEDKTSYIREKFDYFKEKIAEYKRKIGNKIREIFDHFSANEDLRVITSFFEDFWMQAKNQWQKLEFTKLLQDMKKSAFHDIPLKWIKSKVAVEEYDLDEGIIKLKFPQPLNHSNMQLLKNSFIFAKNKLSRKGIYH